MYGVPKVGMWLGILGSLRDPPNFSCHLLSPLAVVVGVCVPGQEGAEVEPSAGELSEAKTQRRPHSAERKSEIGKWSLPLLFCWFCFFL